MYHINVNVFVVSSHGDSGKISEICRTYGDRPVTSKLPRRKGASSQNQRYPYRNFEQAYTTSRGHMFMLPNVAPVHLETSLKRAEDMMFQVRPVTLRVNRFERHHAVQVVLRNCAVISYVFDANNDLHRVYIDQSAQVRTQALCTSAVVTSRKLVLGMDTPSLVAFVHTEIDKAKRPYACPKGNSQTASSSDRQPKDLSFNCTGDLLCAVYQRHICIFIWKQEDRGLADSAADNQSQRRSSRTSVPGPSFSVFTPTRTPNTKAVSRTESPAAAIRTPSAFLARFRSSTISSPSSKSSRMVRAESTPIIKRAKSIGTPRSAARLNFHIAGELLLDKCNILHCSFLDACPETLLLVYEEDLEKQDAPGIKVCKAIFDRHKNSIELISRETAYCLPSEPNLRVTTICRQIVKGKLLLGCSNGMLILLSLGSGNSAVQEVKRIHTEKQYEPALLTWHASGCLFLVFFANGDVCAYDCALQRLAIVGENGISTSCLQLQNYVASAKVTHAVWGIPNGANDGSVDDNSLAIMCDRGPLILIRLNLGSRPGARLLSYDLLAQRLRNKEISEAAEMIQFIDEPEERYKSLTLLVDSLFRMPDQESTLRGILEQHWPRYSDASEPYHLQVVNIYTRLLHKLLARSKFEDAFFITKQTNSSQKLFRDLYAWVMQQQRMTIADVVIPFATENLASETQANAPTFEFLLSIFRHREGLEESSLISSAQPKGADELPNDISVG